MSEVKFIGRVLQTVGIVLCLFSAFTGWFHFGIILIALLGLALSHAEKLQPIVQQSDTVSPSINMSKENVKVWLHEFFSVFRWASISIVLAFLLVLATIVLFRNHTKTRNTGHKLKEVALALQKFKMESGAYPNDLHELVGKDPLKRDWLYDSWERPLHYQNLGNSFVVHSSGKDGKLGNEDDITL